MLHRCRFALLTVLIGLAAACSKAPGKAILGEWREQNGKEVLEFFKDGTLSVDGAIVGDFVFLDQNRVKLNLTGWGALAGPQMFTLDVNTTTLSLTDHRGKTSVYIRSEAAGKAPAGGGASPPASRNAAAEAPKSDKERAIAEYRKAVDESTDLMVAMADADIDVLDTLTMLQKKGVEEVMKSHSSAEEFRKSLKVLQRTLRKQQVPEDGGGVTKSNLSALRSALSIYYGDLEGVYPAELTLLTVDGKYLSSIPPASTGHHPPSNSVISACTVGQLKDTGGWAYCNNQRDNQNFGNIKVDCTHKDSVGKQPWHSY